MTRREARLEGCHAEGSRDEIVKDELKPFKRLQIFQSIGNRELLIGSRRGVMF